MEVARRAALEEGELALGTTEVFASFGIPDGDDFRFFVSYAAVVTEGTVISRPGLQVTVSAEGRTLAREACDAGDIGFSLEGFVPATTPAFDMLPPDRRMELEAQFSGAGQTRGELFELLAPHGQWAFYEALSPGLLASLGLDS